MALFGKKGQPQQQPSSSSEAEDNVPIPDPGLEQYDPRQMLFTMLRDSGICFVLSGTVPVEDTLAEAVRLAPALRRSSHIGHGFLQLDQDPPTVWTTVDSPRGSAVVVISSSSSNSDFLFNEVLQAFERTQHPYSREMVFSGMTSRRLSAIIAGGDVAPVWELPALKHTADPKGYGTLPVSIRRAASGWGRVDCDLYKRDFQTQGPEGRCVFLGLLGSPGWPQLLTSLGENPGVSLDQLVPLTTDSPYSFEPFDDAIILSRRLPQGLDETSLRQLAQQLVDDLEARLSVLRSRSEPSLPVEPSTDSVWERLEGPANAARIARRLKWPMSSVTYTVTEHVRLSAPGEESTFESVDFLARQLRAQRASGFEYAWRGDDDILLSPTWLTFNSAAFDSETGRFVAAGHLTHETWGLPPAHDLGAIDGRNAFGFPEQGHAGGLLWPASSLYVGSTRTGAIAPLDATVNLRSVDLHGATGNIAALESLGGSTGAASVYDPSGKRRLLTVIEDFDGDEHIRFSGDGEWLLITGAGRARVVEVATGRWLRLDVANASWWPLGDSRILTVTHQNGAATPRLFNLEWGTYTRTFPEISLDVPFLPSFPYAWFPSVSPDGTELLVHTPAGVTPEYQKEHGVGNHLARVALDSGRGHMVGGAFLDAGSTLERDVGDARWTGRVPSTCVKLHPILARQLRSPVLEHEYLHPGRWADEAEQVLVKTLNRAIDQTQNGQDSSHLVPEILASLVPIAHNSDAWGRQSEWLIGLEQTTANMVLSGSLTGDMATGWQRFGLAIAALRAGRPELIDPVATVGFNAVPAG